MRLHLSAVAYFKNISPQLLSMVVCGLWLRLDVCGRILNLSTVDICFLLRTLKMCSVCLSAQLAAFLITRPPYAYITYGWKGCGGPSKAAGRDYWEPLFDLDVGEPLGLCTEEKPGVFSRQWSKGSATLDCARFEATLTFELKRPNPMIGRPEPDFKSLFKSALKSDEDPPENSKTNVLHIVIGDLRIDLPAHGQHHVSARNLAKLAQESLLFDNAYFNQSVCSPSKNTFCEGCLNKST